MESVENLPDAKMYRADEDGKNIRAYEPENRFQLHRTDLGTRLLVTTSEDRIEVFKRLLDLYPGPFFITLVIQEAHGAFKKTGRYYGDRGKTRVQIDFFLDHFHDYFCYDGMHHLWVSCESSDGIVVFDQHDLFYVYQRAAEAGGMLLDAGYKEGLGDEPFNHAHRSRPEIVPGPKEILEFTKWFIAPLQINDVADPSEKSLKNMVMKARMGRAVKKIKKGQRGRIE